MAEECASMWNRLFNAEYWAKAFASQKFDEVITPIQNFEFNILKAKILHASAEEIAEIWPKVVSKIGSEQLTDIIGTGFASYFVYTEQALVTAVSASEVYFKDMLAEAIQSEKNILKRYLDKGIKVRRIVESNLDLSNNIGKLIVENMNFQILDNVQNEYNKVFGYDILSKQNFRNMKTIFSIRHAIVHRAGIVDSTFLFQTGLDYEIGVRVCFKRKEIQEMIDFISQTIYKVDKKLKSKIEKKR